MTGTTDTARLPLLLSTLRLPTIARPGPAIGQTAGTENWPAARTLATLFEHESPNAPTGVPRAALPKRACHRARRSTRSTSRPRR